MIRIEKITIREFRGIRELTLKLDGANFAACGPNGTGKSGIVDAIEFGLTGNISRLAGQGTGNLSVKQHGPHVDFRNKPEEASVTVEVSIPSLKGKKATIHRTVKGLSAPTITPAEPAVIAAFDKVKSHPEFVLSRRELIRYVISEPGNRAREVQTLLRLDQVDRLRLVLQRIARSCANEHGPLERGEREAAARLMEALGTDPLSRTAILQAVNAKRAKLGLAALADLSPTTSLADGLASPTTVAGQRVPKAQAVADLAGLCAALEALHIEQVQNECTRASGLLRALAADPVATKALERENLLKDALELYDGEHCPVCDKPIEAGDFAAHIAGKREHLKLIGERRSAIERALEGLRGVIQTAGSALAVMIEYGPLFQPARDVKPLRDAKTWLLGHYQQLGRLVPLEDTIKAVEALEEVPPLSEVLDELSLAIAALPEPSAHDAARDYLNIAQERLEAYRTAKRKAAAAKARAEVAAQVFKTFGDVTTRSLDAIYDEVQETFVACYRHINRDDESNFTAELLPSLGKLGFDVDFYGRGRFPPGAYHSEGHQDGMGLCLYLALMGHLQGKDFTFAVLDDVLMSVDKGHRREVCSLLKQRFPDTQFIFTTHDDVWLRHMKAEGIIRAKGIAHFRNWSVETGPADWTTLSVWDELEELLEANDVNKAAAVLRRYLEYFGGEACHRLRAQVEFRGDGQFVLSDTLPSAVSALGDAFKRARDAANSWNQRDAIEAIKAREVLFAAAKAATQVEQWQLNTAVHYNAWADLERSDFAPVIEAFRKLTASFSCSICEEMFALVPDRGPKEGIRCGCGHLNLNLLRKQGAPAGEQISQAV